MRDTIVLIFTLNGIRRGTSPDRETGAYKVAHAFQAHDRRKNGIQKF